MAATQATRAAKFGRFVTIALNDAKDRGMTIPDIERATGVGKSTLYRWRDGDWTKDPRATQVRAFCEGLGIPLDSAYRVLGWSGNAATEPEPTLDPDLQALARMLRDPNLSDGRKQEIRTMVRYLLRRRDDREVG